jgi:GntR family transcriptional repressor for pyruvate dehydrogenase complex
MSKPIEKEQIDNQIDILTERLERLVLSGDWYIGMQLPQMIELASQLNVEQPILQVALEDMAARGLVNIIPDDGVYVADYRIQGSIEIFSSLMLFKEGKIAPELVVSMMEMRMTVEIESARLAALRRTEEQLEALKKTVSDQFKAKLNDFSKLARLDYRFHHQIALASGNLFYPLLMNSFKGVYNRLVVDFFEFVEPQVIKEIFVYNRGLVHAIQHKRPDQATEMMRNVLNHGASYIAPFLDLE